MSKTTYKFIMTLFFGYIILYWYSQALNYMFNK